MIFQEPLGLLLLGFVPLFWFVMHRAFRRRKLNLAAFYLLQDIIDSLPVLPRSFLFRKKIQRIILITSIFCFSLATSGLVIGSLSAKPFFGIIVLDNLSGFVDDSNPSAGWGGVIRKTDEIVENFKRRDRIILIRSDQSLPVSPPLPPRKIRPLVREMTPSSLSLNTENTRQLLRILSQVNHPDFIFIISPDPTRWRNLQASELLPIKIIRSPGPDTDLNYSILNVDLSVDLLDPRRIDLFCRVGVFSPADNKPSHKADLRVYNNEILVTQRRLDLSNDESKGIVFESLRLNPGTLSLQLTPKDSFAEDNFFSCLVRDSRFLSADMISPGNPALEAALRSLPGLSVTTRQPGEKPLSSSVSSDVKVYDLTSPPETAGNLLIIQPLESFAGTRLRGEASRPQNIEAESSHPLLEGVSFSNLRIDRFPSLIPSPSMEVLAKADGYPLVLVGSNPWGGRLAILGFDPVETGWIYEPSFPILIANLVAWLGEETVGSRSYLLVGESPPREFFDDIAAITDPYQRVSKRPRDGWHLFTLKTAGKYNLQNGRGEKHGQLFVNLLQEKVSRAMFISPKDSGDTLPLSSFKHRLFRFEATTVLLVTGIMLLLLEGVIAPREKLGVLPE